VLAIAVAGIHAHVLVELPDHKKAMKTIVGNCKMKSSHAIRRQMPGRVWGGGGNLKRAYRYILRNVGRGFGRFD
jgi:hypothetical protein